MHGVVEVSGVSIGRAKYVSKQKVKERTYSTLIRKGRRLAASRTCTSLKMQYPAPPLRRSMCYQSFAPARPWGTMEMEDEADEGRLSWVRSGGPIPSNQLKTDTYSVTIETETR